VIELHIGGAGVGLSAHTTPAITTNQFRTRGKRRYSGTPVLHRTSRTPLVLHCTPSVLPLYSTCTPLVLRSTSLYSAILRCTLLYSVVLRCTPLVLHCTPLVLRLYFTRTPEYWSLAFSPLV
jgi:hypothetical protein